MAYNYQNFLRPISSEDRNIQVIDSVGKIKYTINAFHIVNIVVSNNIIKINLKSNKVISLDFNTNNEAREALAFLQTQVDTLVNKVPYNIDKQIENFVLDQSFQGLQGPTGPEGPTGFQGIPGPTGEPQTNIFEITPETGTLTIFGTLSQYGDLLPGYDNEYNLGSPIQQWKSLYVGTSSIYIGGVTLSSHDDSFLMNSINLGNVENPAILRNDGGQLVFGNDAVARYFATSSTSRQLPQIGEIVTLETSRNLAYKQMQQVVVYNQPYNPYAEGYFEDESSFFTGQITSYVSGTESGTLDVLVDYSNNYGVEVDGVVPTYSFWNINISPKNFNQSSSTQSVITEITPVGGDLIINATVSLSGDFLPDLDNTWNLGSPDLQWKSLYVGGSSIYIGGVTISSVNDGILVDKIDVSQIDTETVIVDTINSATDIITINSTQSIFGSLLPGTTSLYSLGSPDFEWHSLHVGTNSIYIGGVTLSSSGDSILVNSFNLGTRENPIILKNDEGTILYGDIPVTKYYATSSTSLQLPDIDDIVTLYTSRNLSYRPMQKVVVYNVAYEGYMVDDYVDDDSVFFTGLVDSYVSGTESGQLEVIVDYSSGFGLTNSENIVPTYSFWNIDVSSQNWGTVNITINDPVSNGIVLSDGTVSDLNVTNDITYDGLTFSINTNTVFLGQVNMQQVVEKIISSTASSEIEYDFSQSAIWYHNDLSGNFTASFINVPESDSAITLNIVIEQSGTAYLPTDAKINGNTYTIYWNSGILPTGTPNFVDIVGLSILQFNSSIKVLGQVSSFSQP